MTSEGLRVRAAGAPDRLAELMATARAYFIPASGRWLLEIPAFSFTLWVIAEDEKAGRIKLAGKVARWLRKEAA